MAEEARQHVLNAIPRCATQLRRLGVRAFAHAAMVLAAVLLAAAQAAAAPPAKQGPNWAELPVEQQQVLDPLKNEWEKLDRQQRIKWVGIAKRYPSMTVTGQRRVQMRMQNWAKLTPDQRAAARSNYRNTVSKLPPEKRKDLRAQWLEYQALPEEQKRSLAAKAAEAKPAAPAAPAKSGTRQRGAAAKPAPGNERLSSP